MALSSLKKRIARLAPSRLHGSSSGASSILGSGALGRTLPAVGVDFGNRHLKAAVLASGTGKKPVVEHLLSARVPAAMVAGTEILDAEGLAEELMRLFDGAGLKRFRATLAVGGSDAFIRRVSIQRMSYQDALEHLPKNQGLKLPLDIKYTKLDLHILDPRGDGATMQVLIVAAKRESIAQRQKVVMEAGALIHSVDVDAFALFNLFAYCHGDAAKEQVTLVDLGHESSLIVVLERGSPAVARRAYVGISHLLERLAEGGSLLPDEAEQVLTGESPTALYPGPFRAWAEQLADEIARSAAAVRRNDGTREVVHLTGGGSLVAGLPQFLGERTGLPVHAFDPLTTLPVAGGLPLDQQRSGPAHALALGLALRQVV